MSREQITDLKKFLKPFSPEVQHRVFSLREFVWNLYPQANELIYDNYNALAIGWSPTDRVSHAFCSIAAYRTNSNIHFGFYWGSEISDPKKILIGNGKQYRYILVPRFGEVPQNLHQKTRKRRISEFTKEGKRQKADRQRADNYKIHFCCQENRKENSIIR